jgi:hypothetical protein
MSKKDGGPAFPSMYETFSQSEGQAIHFSNVGMTLRDYFAGQALVGLLAHPDCKDMYAITTLIGREAYMAADSMLAARESGNE